MNSTNRFERLLFVCLGALLLAVAGCGPGVGGTGTGVRPADALNTFGASPAQLCASDVAQVVCDPAPGAAPGSGPVPGQIQVVWLADDFTAANVLARIDQNEILLRIPCEGLQFTGVWGQAPSQTQRFYGVLERPSAEGPAMLTLQRTNEGLSAQLLGAEGQPVSAPRRLQRGDGAPQAADCR